MQLNGSELLIVQDVLEDYVNSVQTLESQKFKAQDLLSKIQAYYEWLKENDESIRWIFKRNRKGTIKRA